MTPFVCQHRKASSGCVRACVRARLGGSLSELLEPGRVPVCVFAPDVCAPHPIGILRALEKASLFPDQRSLEAPPRLRRFEDKRRDSTSHPDRKSLPSCLRGALAARHGCRFENANVTEPLQGATSSFMVRGGIFFPSFY